MVAYFVVLSPKKMQCDYCALFLTDKGNLGPALIPGFLLEPLVGDTGTLLPFLVRCGAASRPATPASDMYVMQVNV